MALRSMTAFGRATLTNSLGRFTVELQSLNRKHLDFSVQLPSELHCFEPDIRKWISSAISRGQLTLKLSAVFEDVAPVSVKPNLPYVRQLISAWDAIAKEVGVPLKNELKLQLLANSEGVVTFENLAFDDDALCKTLHNAVNMALDKLIGMKDTEGQALQHDISLRLINLENLVIKIDKLLPEAINRYRAKLKDRLAEFLTDAIENEERMLREVCIHADRIDIAEEIARFKSHLDQFNGLLTNLESDQGKTLDFLIQELKREANTIGAKSLDIEIAQLVIEMKTEVERIREQVQNVE